MKLSSKQVVVYTIIATLLVAYVKLFFENNNTTLDIDVPFEVSQKGDWYHYSNEVFSFDYPNKLQKSHSSYAAVGRLSDENLRISYCVNNYCGTWRESYEELLSHQNSKTLGRYILDYDQFVKDSIHQLHPDYSKNELDELFKTKRQFYKYEEMDDPMEWHTLENIVIVDKDTIATSVQVGGLHLHWLLQHETENHVIDNTFRKIHYPKHDLSDEYGVHAYWGKFVINGGSLSKEDAIRVLKSIRIQGDQQGYLLPE